MITHEINVKPHTFRLCWSTDLAEQNEVLVDSRDKSKKVFLPVESINHFARMYGAMCSHYPLEFATILDKSNGPITAINAHGYSFPNLPPDKVEWVICEDGGKLRAVDLVERIKEGALIINACNPHEKELGTALVPTLYPVSCTGLVDMGMGNVSMRLKLPQSIKRVGKRRAEQVCLDFLDGVKNLERNNYPSIDERRPIDEQRKETYEWYKNDWMKVIDDRTLKYVCGVLRSLYHENK